MWIIQPGFSKCFQTLSSLETNLKNGKSQQTDVTPKNQVGNYRTEKHSRGHEQACWVVFLVELADSGTTAIGGANMCILGIAEGWGQCVGLRKCQKGG